MAAGRGAPLPPFGGWDERDPTAGGEYTVIFNQARDERKAGGAAMLQPEAPAKMQPTDNHQTEKASKLSRWSCCFGSSNAD